ncbi:MAG: tetratricopeptide repeat protein [Deltaproteobacteria bacterium]|nr:tetratricopeptide repeat protein [Deltaproteobacteria bacterium]
MKKKRKRTRQATLGTVMIVKNEEHRLGNILSDIQDFVDEVVVVDTGSTDKTVSIARSFGVTLGHFPWCSDFSAARNASIELARSDYLLWLDADDRIDEKERQALLKFKKQLGFAKKRAYMLKIVNEDCGGSRTMSYQVRVFPNRNDIRFEGRIHEQLLPILQRNSIGVEALDITIRHTGYQDDQTRMEKGRRNLEILLEELNQGKDTATQNFFIAMSYYAILEYENCLEYIARARQKYHQENWFKYSYSLGADCYLKLNRREEAARELVQALQRFPECGLLNYRLGSVHIIAGRFDEAITALEKAASLDIEIEIFPIPPDIREKLPFYYGLALERVGRLDEAIKAYQASIRVNADCYPALRGLGIAYLLQDRTDEALPWLEKAKRFARDYDHLLWDGLARAYSISGRFSEALGLYSEALKAKPADRKALTGIIFSSIELDDVDSLVTALDSMMRSLGIETDREINSFREMAEICAEVGEALFAENDNVTAWKLAEAALRIDRTCSRAHLLGADLALASGNRKECVTQLQDELLNGASSQKAEQSVQRIVR